MAHSPMNERAPQEQEKYIVRFPDGMRERLKEAASKNQRSLNAEIIHRLQISLEADEQSVEKIIDSYDNSPEQDPMMEFFRGLDEKYQFILDEVKAINERYEADIKERRAKYPGRTFPPKPKP